MTDQTRERVLEQIAELFDVDAETLGEDTTFESLDGDSLDAVELVMNLEEEFDVVIPEDRTGDITTVGHAVRLMRELCS